MDWIKLEDELPPKNTLVFIKRTANKVEEAPIYIGMRNGRPLSTNPDASKDSFWYGSNIKSLKDEQQQTHLLMFNSSFSDITVLEWAAIGTNNSLSDN